MPLKNKQELVKQIESYNLKLKFKQLEEKDQKIRPFRHLPKQFSKGILIGNIAIVPRKHHEGRYVYVIADMVEAKILHEEVWLKQTAILVAHYLSEQRHIPEQLLKLDVDFASKLFDIRNFKRFYRMAKKEKDDNKAFVYENKFLIANDKADAIKSRIQDIFDDTFRVDRTK
jgi:hypothetical protein